MKRLEAGGSIAKGCSVSSEDLKVQRLAALRSLITKLANSSEPSEAHGRNQ